MKTSLRRALVLASAISFLALASAAEAGTTFPKMVLKFGHSGQPGQNNSNGVLKFADLVKERTGGSVEVQVFPASQLGSTTAILEQIKAGLTHFTFTGPEELSTIEGWGPIGVLSMPYVVKGNNDEAQYAYLRKLVRGPIFKELNEKAGPATNLYALDMAWWFGNRYLTTKTKQVVHPDDLKGLKIRTLDTPMARVGVKALGATPVPMNISEVYTALQMGVVEGEENPYNVILGFKFYEVQKYLATTGHMTTALQIVCNYKWLQGLSPELRDVLIKSAIDAGDYQSDLQVKSAAANRETLKQHGMIITDINKAEFAERTMHAWKPFEPLFGKGFYERVTAAN
jgi:TRAP-type transport system periplasmic protein